jgi:hypothetical protein
MITTLATFVLLGQQELMVEEYFPLQSGIIRFYDEDFEHKGKRSKFTIIEKIIGSSELKRYEKYIDETELDPSLKEKVRPVIGEGIEVTTSVEGQTPASTFYKIEGRTVFIVGVEKGALLVNAYPIVSIGRNPETWVYSGPIDVMGAPAPAIIEGETKIIRDYKFNNKTYPAIEAKVKYTINLEPAGIAESHQRAIYARGLGLVEYEETGKVGDNVTKRKRKLSRIQLP